MTIHIAFLSHDWKDSFNIDAFNRISKRVNEPLQITELPTHSDSFGYIVHSLSFDLREVLTPKEHDEFWNHLEGIVYGDFEYVTNDIASYYENGIFTFADVEEFRRLLVETV